MSGGPIRSAIVVGDGIAAWTGASALARRVPGIAVTVIGTVDPQVDLVDLVASTPPSSRDFHTDLGLEDQQVVAQTRGAWRLGTHVALDARGYAYGYGPAGEPIAGLPFATAWALTDWPFHACSPAARLGLAARMPSGDPLFAGVGVGLSLDPARYRHFIAAYARHLGVTAPRAHFAQVSIDGDRIAAITLDDGERLSADLFVDASGSARRLLRVVHGDAFEDWSRWLPANRAIRAAAAPVAELPTLDRATEVAGGWHVVSALPDRMDHLLAYASDRIADDVAAHALGDQAGSMPTVPISFVAGRTERAWVGNTVAIGDAQAVVGPLGAAPMRLLQTQVDRLVRSLPGRDFAAVELADLNREAAQEAERLRDFQIAHAPMADPPATLADTLARFARRGRWRQRDGELAGRDEWIAVMAGTGLRPSIIDAVARMVDRGQVAREMTRYRQSLDTAVAAAPLHRATLPR